MHRPLSLRNHAYSVLLFLSRHSTWYAKIWKINAAVCLSNRIIESILIISAILSIFPSIAQNSIPRCDCWAHSINRKNRPPAIHQGP